MDKTEIKPVGGNSPAGKNKIEVTNPKQKEILMGAGIAAAVLGVAGGAYALHSMEIDDVPPDPTPVPPVPPTPIPIYTDAPVATCVNDDMSFGEAFAAARAEVGPGGFFVWEGAAYNTYYAEEWAAMSPEEQQQFQASITMPSQSTNPITVEETADAGAGVVTEGDTEENSQNGSDGQDIIDNEVDDTVNGFNGGDVIDVSGTIGEEGVIEQTGGSGLDIMEEPGVPAPDIIEIDLDGDGIIDALAIDYNYDGLADAILVDTDGSGAPDMYIIDSDDIPGLDLTILDPSETGDLENGIQLPMDEQVIIEIDSPVAEPLDGEFGNDYDQFANNNEIMPDIDNNFDVSDFDDPSLLG